MQKYLTLLKKDIHAWDQIPQELKESTVFIKEAIDVDFRIFSLLSPKKALDEDIQNETIEKAWEYINSLSEKYRKYLPKDEAEQRKKWLILDWEEMFADKIEEATNILNKTK